MKTNNDQLDEQNLTPEEENAAVVVSGCFATLFFMLLFSFIISAIVFANKGVIGDKKDFSYYFRGKEGKN